MDNQIRDTINSFDMEHARELLYIALRQNPTAETYYLASQVALNDEQKRDFLEKALQLDPFHRGAMAALSNIRNQNRNSVSSPAVQQLAQIPNPTMPPASVHVGPPYNTTPPAPFFQPGYLPVQKPASKSSKTLPLILAGGGILAILFIGLIVFLLIPKENKESSDFPVPANVTKLPASDTDIRNALLSLEKETSSSSSSFNSYYSKFDFMEAYISKDSRASVITKYRNASKIGGFDTIYATPRDGFFVYTKGTRGVLFFVGSIDKSQTAGGCGCIFGIDKIPPAIQKNVSEGDTLIYELKGSSTLVESFLQ